MKTKRQIQKKTWAAKNKDKVNKANMDWYRKNKEICKEHHIKWRENNQAACTAKNAKYKASKINATPDWANLDKIKVLYEKCKWLESLTGLKYHVDHIIPLQGKNVSGLHVWENLQILEANLNISKSNKY